MSDEASPARLHGSTKATLIGLLAVAFWSAIVGLIRAVSESFGATGGAALIYTVGSVLLLFRFPSLRVLIPEQCLETFPCLP